MHFSPHASMERIDPTSLPSRHITTGDGSIDEIFSGGVMVGSITELVGESGSGKTQLALQFCLMVQLPVEKGGCLGSACSLTTSGVLPTGRLQQLIQEHSSLTSEESSLENIHTRSVSSPAELRRTLQQGIPSLIQQISGQGGSKLPLKLLILDSLAGVFRMAGKTTSETLMERSRELNDISALLHHLASTYNLAIVVINDVTSVISRDGMLPSQQGERGDAESIYYGDQVRWFSRAGSLPSEEGFEASLGLVWANQVSVRIMMTRTGRRRFLSDNTPRSRGTGAGSGQGDTDEEDATLIRRLSVVFSSFSEPSSIDFIVSEAGVISIGQRAMILT